MPHGIRITAGLLALALLAFCSCAEERPTQPGPARYLVYADFTGDRVWEDSNGVFHGEYTHRLYIYSADSNLALVDSIMLDADTRTADQLLVSPDGRWLYRQGEWPYYPDIVRLEKWDLRTKSIVWTIPGGGATSLLHGGQWILRADELGGGQIFQATDGQPIGTISDTLEVGRGPVSGTKVAVTTKEDFGEALRWEVLRVLDVASGEIYGRWVPYLRVGGAIALVYYARVHPDGRRVAVIGQHNGSPFAWFAVGDVLTGETLLEHRLIYPYGQISISDDGRYATATDPSRFLIYDSYPSLDLFDLESMQHLKHFGRVGPDFDSLNLDLWPFYGQAYFIPGSDLIVGGGPPGFAQGVGPLFVLNLTSMAVEHIRWSPLHLPREGPGLREGAYVGGMAVGPKP